MKKLFIILISFNIFPTYSSASEYPHLKALGLSDSSVLNLSCEERIKKTNRFNHCNYRNHMRDGDVFSDYIRESNSALDYKTVTNNTDQKMYVQVYYKGPITYGLYGRSSISYWYVHLNPNECVKIYQSNSYISADFYDPVIFKLDLIQDNGNIRRFCYPCSNKNYTMRDFIISYRLSESDTVNDSCDSSVDLKVLLPL